MRQHDDAMTAPVQLRRDGPAYESGATGYRDGEWPIIGFDGGEEGRDRSSPVPKDPPKLRSNDQPVSDLAEWAEGQFVDHLVLDEGASGDGPKEVLVLPAAIWA